jgi:signal transduction histidine kinase
MSALMFVNTAHDLPMLMAILVFAAVIAGYTAVRLSSGISGSVSVLADRARRLSEGDLSVRMALSQGDPDIAEMAMAFNEMAANLEEAAAKKEQVEQSRRELSAAISHDLRTPISSARVMLEAIRDGVIGGDEERDEYLDRVLTQVKSLGSMVDDLFDLSLLDAGELRLDLHMTAVDELVGEALISMQSTATGKGLTLSAMVDKTLGEAVMDSRQVRRVLLNLVQNAIRHTPPDGTVTVAVNRVDDGVEFEVRDTGEGFDVADSARIWTRFFGSDPARSRVDDGSAQSGLGLAIARGIVELHGGTISAHSTPSNGATFRFSIPDRQPATVGP